jgi:hypothetical protein
MGILSGKMGTLNGKMGILPSRLFSLPPFQFIPHFLPPFPSSIPHFVDVTVSKKKTSLTKLTSGKMGKFATHQSLTKNW